MSFIDINNDGFQDIYVCKSGMHTEQYRTNELYINQGNQTFKEDAKSYGLDDHSFSNQAYFLDIDQDQDLDMYLVNHPIDWPNINKIMTGDQNKDGFDYQFSDKLYKNEDGKYVDITKQAGILNRSWGLSAAVGDFNDDQLPDIYVANDFIKPDNLYINQGNGTYKDEALSFFRHISFYSMGTDFADINNDGRNDLFVADMAMKSHGRSKRNMGSMSTENFNTIIRRGYHYPYSINTLQYNIGNGQFVDIAQSAGIDKTDWSWAPLLADFDNDGHKDLFVTNGIYRDIIDNDFLAQKEKYDTLSKKKYFADLIPLIPQTKVHNHIFKNSGQYQFEDMSEAWGLTDATNSNGAAYADLDNDGDLDLVINNLNEPSFIFENKCTDAATNNFIKIKLKGSEKNINTIGATVQIVHDDKLQRQDIQPNRGYLSSVDPILHFGVGESTLIESIKITWPDGKQTWLKNKKANTTLKVDHGRSAMTKPQNNDPKTKWIEDITEKSKINFTHKETPYDDFATELLLPHKLSQSGPFISVADVNGDGREDFYVGGAAGQAGQLSIQNEDSSFSSIASEAWSRDREYEDQASIFIDYDNDGDLDLYIVSGSNEFRDSKNYQDRLYQNDGKGNFTKTKNILPKIVSSGMDVKSIDFDGDGDVDLVSGGRLVAGAYPTPPRSYLLENRKGKFYDVTEELASELSDIGMVTAIAVNDIDNDGDEDFVVVGEWMSISTFINKEGSFQKSENIIDAEHTEGWWQSLTVADIDQDGDNDIIAGNIGANNKYHPTPNNPLWVYYADFDKNGNPDIVLSKESANQHLPIRGRECSSQQMPFIQEKFPSYKSYSDASLFDIYSEESLENALKMKVTNFNSIILENDGSGNFEMKPMHPYAQMSPINSSLLIDLNNDDNLDLICVGNMFTPETETVRYDAGHGTILLATANGSYDPVLPTESGFRLSGDTKDMKSIELNNGDTGILVANNNDKLMLWRINQKDNDEVL